MTVFKEWKGLHHSTYTKNLYRILFQSTSHERKVGKGPKSDPALERNNFARSRRAATILCHTQSLERKFVGLLVLSSRRVDFVVIKDIIVFVNSLACPAVEGIMSF